MRLRNSSFSLLLFSLTLAAPGTGFAGGYDWYQSLESSYADGYEDVWGLTTHGDTIYAAARTVLVKYDADGRELWRREPETTFGDEIFRVATDAGGVYVAGRMLVQKFDHDGNVLWTNRDAEHGGEIWGLVVADGGVYITGYRYPGGGVISRLTSDGATLWVRSVSAGSSIGGPVRGAIAVGNGAVYVALDDHIAVYDTSGGYRTDLDVPFFTDGLVLYDNQLYLAGYDYSTAHPNLARTDLQGNVEWQRPLPTEYWPLGDFTVTDTGVLLATSTYDPRHREAPSAVVLHFDAYGIERELWSLAGEDLDATGPDIQPAPITASANGIYMGGIASDVPLYDGFVAQLKIQPRYWKLAAITDANWNSTPELAALRTLPNGTTEVIIKDAVTNQVIGRLPFALAGALEIDVAGVLDMNGNGTAEVAVLFRKGNGQGVVQIRDAGTGAWITQMQFAGAAWDVKALVDLDLDGDRVSELGVLAQTDDFQSVGVQVRNSITKTQLRWVGLPDPYPWETVLDVTSVADANGNGFPEVAALYHEDTSWGVARYFVTDSTSKGLISEGVSAQPAFPEPERRALALTGVLSPSIGGGPGLAVLFDKPAGQGVAELASAATGVVTDAIFFVGKSWKVRDVVSHDLDLDGVSELSVLAEADDGSASGIQIKDARTGSQVRWIGLPPN